MSAFGRLPEKLPPAAIVLGGSDAPPIGVAEEEERFAIALAGEASEDRQRLGIAPRSDKLHGARNLGVIDLHRRINASLARSLPASTQPLDGDG